jgi:hypothetical protein
MSPAPRTLRVIDVLSVSGLVAALAIVFWPTHVSIDVRTPATLVDGAAVPRIASVADSGDDAATVVGANVMSAARRAPATRYVSPDLQVENAYSPPAAFQRPSAGDSAAMDSTGNADAVPAVYGILNMNGVWHALVRLSAADPNPRLLKVGDRRGSYRVVSIASDRVVVASGDAQRTLKLSRTQRADSTQHKP